MGVNIHEETVSKYYKGVALVIRLCPSAGRFLELWTDIALFSAFLSPKMFIAFSIFLQALAPTIWGLEKAGSETLILALQLGVLLLPVLTKREQGKSCDNMLFRR